MQCAWRVYFASSFTMFMFSGIQQWFNCGSLILYLEIFLQAMFTYRSKSLTLSVALEYIGVRRRSKHRSQMIVLDWKSPRTDWSDPERPPHPLNSYNKHSPKPNPSVMRFAHTDLHTSLIFSFQFKVNVHFTNIILGTT